MKVTLENEFHKKRKREGNISRTSGHRFSGNTVYEKLEDDSQNP